MLEPASVLLRFRPEPSRERVQRVSEIEYIALLWRVEFVKHGANVKGKYTSITQLDGRSYLRNQQNKTLTKNRELVFLFLFLSFLEIVSLGSVFF